MQFTNRERRRTGALTALFKEAFSDRPRLNPSTYLVINAGIGVVLCVLAAAMWSEPARSPRIATLALGAIGCTLLSSLMFNARAERSPRVLFSYGLMLTGLALVLTGASVVWALRAPQHSSFRYGPGVMLVLFTYGMLQIAAASTTPERGIRLRRAGLWGGLLCEALVLMSFVVRAL